MVPNPLWTRFARLAVAGVDDGYSFEMFGGFATPKMFREGRVNEFDTMNAECEECWFEMSRNRNGIAFALGAIEAFCLNGWHGGRETQMESVADMYRRVSRVLLLPGWTEVEAAYNTYVDMFWVLVDVDVYPRAWEPGFFKRFERGSAKMRHALELVTLLFGVHMDGGANTPFREMRDVVLAPWIRMNFAARAIQTAWRRERGRIRLCRQMQQLRIVRLARLVRGDA
jgi:hypothetical protein